MPSSIHSWPTVGLVLVVFVHVCSVLSVQQNHSVEKGLIDQSYTPIITDVIVEPEHLTVEWALPRTAALLEAEKYLQSYDISYRERGAREWQTVTGVSGMAYSATSPGTYEVQEIRSRVSEGQTIADGWFVLSSTSRSHIRWDIERFGVTPRLSWDASSAEIADALSQLEQLEPFLPIHVEEHSSSVDGTRAWRVTFMGISSEPLPILDIAEHSFDANIWPPEIGSPIYVTRLQRTVSVDDDSDTHKPVCVSTEIPGPLLNLNQLQPLPCRHRLTGLIPSVTYEFRVRARVHPYGAMPYSVPFIGQPVSSPLSYSPTTQMVPPRLLGWTASGVVLEISLPLVGFDHIPRDQVFMQSIVSRVEVQFTTTGGDNETNLPTWQTVHVTPTNLIAVVDPNSPEKAFLARGKVHISPLKPSTLYSFRVRGVASLDGFHIPLDHLLLSAWSNVLASVPTRPSPPNSPPVQVVPESVRSTEVTLEWSYTSQSTIFGVFQSTPIAFVVEYAKNPFTHTATESMWQNAVTVGGRDALLTLGRGPVPDDTITTRGMGAEVYSIRCNGIAITSPSAPMLDWAALLQNEGWDTSLVAASYPQQDDTDTQSSQCTYRFTIHGLDPAAIYHFRVRVIGLFEAPSDVNAAFYLKDLQKESLSSQDQDAAVVQSVVLSAGHDFRRYARARTHPLAIGTVNGQSGRTSQVSPSNVEVSRSAKERLLYALVSPECPLVTATASDHSSRFPSLAHKGTGSIPGGVDDEFYIPSIGMGGGHTSAFGSGYGSPGMAVISLYLNSDGKAPQSPIETIVFRYDPLTGVLSQPASHELPHTQLITQELDMRDKQQTSFPFEFSVPNTTTLTTRSFGAPIEKVAYATIRLWGAGGGCGYTPGRGTSFSTLLPPDVPSEYEDVGPLPGSTGIDPVTGIDSCVPGAGGSYVATTVAVSPGDRFVIFLGQGGGPGTGEKGGVGGWPGGGAGGNGKRGGGGGGGGSTIVYQMFHSQDIPQHSTSLLSLLDTSVPVAVAAGGAGSGASDYCCSYGGPGGDLCSEASSGYEPQLTIPLSEEQESFNDGFEPELGESGTSLYAEHPDAMFNEHKFFSSRKEYREAIGFGGAGARFFSAGLPGRSGALFSPLSQHPQTNEQSFETHSTSLSKENKAPVSSSSRVDLSISPSMPYSAASAKGGYLRGGRGASGWQGGGGGGGGIFGGGGGGSGIDGAGGGGGISYIHFPYVYHFQTSEAVTQLSSFVFHAADTVSALVSWNSMRWVRNNRPGSTGHLVSEELDITTYQIEVTKLSAPLFEQYTSDGKVLDTVYSQEWAWTVVWQGSGFENPYGIVSLLPTGGNVPNLHRLASVLTPLEPNSYYFARIRGLHPTRFHLLAPSNVVTIQTQATDIPSWSPVFVQPEEGKRWSHEWQSFIAAATDDASNEFMNGEIMQYLEQNVPPALRGSSLTPVAGYLVMFGGFSDGVDCSAEKTSAACAKWAGLRSETWRFDPVLNSWYQFPLLKAYSPPARERHVATSVNNRLYIFGGKGLQSNSYEVEALSDLWVFDMGVALGTQLRTTVHSGSAIAVANKVEDDTYPVYDASCGVSNGGQCGIKDGRSMTFGLRILSETEKQQMEDASIPFGLSDGNIFVSDEALGDDSCIEDISVWMELVHPCLSALEISLIGPGPGMESVRLDGFEARDAPTSFRPTDPMSVQNEDDVFHLFGHRRAKVFHGGSGHGSASLYHECIHSTDQELHKGYWTNPATTEAFVGWSKSMQSPVHETYGTWMDSVLSKSKAALSSSDTCLVHHSEDTHSILTDSTLAVFGEQFRTDQTACCKEQMVYPPPEISINGSPIMDTVSSAPSDVRNIHESGEKVTYLRGHYKSLDSLRASFMSHSATGLWGLEIVDKYGLPMEGRLLRWGLVLDTVQCKKKPTWTLLEPSITEPEDPSASIFRPVGRYDAISAVVDGGWYIMGGKGQNRVLNDIWRYDFDSALWTQIVPFSSEPVAKPSTTFPQRPQTLHSPLSPTSLSGRSVVLSPWGLVSIGGLSGRSDVATVTSSQKSNLIATPKTPDSLVLELWDFRTLSWRPIETRVSYSEVVALFGGRPANRVHANAVLLGTPNSCTSRRGSKLELLLMGGTKAINGEILSDAWKIDAQELFTLEQLTRQSNYNASSALGQSRFFRDSQILHYQGQGIGKTSGFGSASMQELDDYLRGDVKLLHFDAEWSSLCSTSIRSGSAREATWKKWCVEGATDASTNGQYQCTIEEVLFRAYCERRWQSLGNW